MRNGAIGAIVLADRLPVRGELGPNGLAAAWIVAYPIYLGISLWRSLPVIGTTATGAVADAIAPAMLAALGMALAVVLVDDILPPLHPLPRLAILVATGGIVYAGWLMIFARTVIRELIAIVRKQPLPA